MNLSGNTVLVTGGATGIGFALAEAFQKAGNTVAVCGRREDRLAEAQARLPGLKVLACDLSDDAERQRLADWLADQCPALNILVNNAGIQRDIDFTAGPAALEGPNELRIDLEAPIALTALLIPRLRTQPGAAIINVTSGIALRPSVRMPLYSTAKAALHVLTGLLREQLAPIGIKVFEAIPPLILDTELNPEGRALAKARDGRSDASRFSRLHIPTAAQYAASVLGNLSRDIPEFGFGISEEYRRQSGPMPASDSEVLDRVVTARCSSRGFTDAVPARELIAEVIEAGRQAPYAGLANRGTNDFRHFFVVAKGSAAAAQLHEACAAAVRRLLPRYESQSQPRMEAMLQVMRMIAEKGLPPWNAPWLVLVAERKGYPAREDESLACCLENMWLKAASLGLGFQWLSAIRDLEGSAELAAVTGLPADEYAFAACQLGWPAAQPRQQPRPEPLPSVTWID